MSIYIIAVLLENCPACEHFKSTYWNNIDENWQNLAQSYNFKTFTYIIPSRMNMQQHNKYKNFLIEQGIDYIDSYPFIFAVKNFNYDAKSIIPYCADYDYSINRFIYRKSSSPCRNRQSFINFLNKVNNEFLY